MATVNDLTACRVTLVRVPLGRDGAVVAVERRLANSLRRVNDRYLADPRSRHYPIRKADTGAFNCRQKASGGWSKHAFGAAIDVNWSTNGMNASHHDMPAWLVAMFLAEGWGWGGNWHSSKDWMHFSKFTNEGGDGRLEEGPVTPPAKEDDMAVVDQKVFDKLVKDVTTIRVLALVQRVVWFEVLEVTSGVDGHVVSLPS